jgi:hypothetical protein
MSSTVRVPAVPTTTICILFAGSESPPLKKLTLLQPNPCRVRPSFSPVAFRSDAPSGIGGNTTWRGGAFVEQTPRQAPATRAATNPALSILGISPVVHASSFVRALPFRIGAELLRRTELLRIACSASPGILAKIRESMQPIMGRSDAEAARETTSIEPSAGLIGVRTSASRLVFDGWRPSGRIVEAEDAGRLVIGEGFGVASP